MLAGSARTVTSPTQEVPPVPTRTDAELDDALGLVPSLPDPAVQPTVDLWPTAGRALGIGRNTAYESARRGEIPTIRLGHRILVPIAALRRMLALDDPPDAA